MNGFSEDAKTKNKSSPTFLKKLTPNSTVATKTLLEAKLLLPLLT
jgi:hypothetical protein